MSVPQVRLAGLIPDKFYSGAVAGGAQMADSAGFNAHAGGDHSPGPDIQHVTAPLDSPHNKSASGCSFAVALSLGVFFAIWAMGFWMTPSAAAWARSLPLGLGLPLFVLIGAGLSMLGFALPLVTWGLAASGMEARQGGDVEQAPREARKPDPKGCAQ